MKIFRPLILAAAAAATFAGPAFAADENSVVGLEIKTQGMLSSIIVSFSKDAAYNQPIFLEDPYRLLVDFVDKNVTSDQQDVEVNQGMVKGIRFEYAKSDLKRKPLQYLIIELDGIPSFTLREKGKKITLSVSPAGMKGQAAAIAPSVRRLNDLDSCVQTALASNPQISLASDEIHLANIKASEALRALFPGLTAKYEQTRGDAVRDLGTPAFDEKSYGLQFNQVLYQGGKLKATYKQAKLNLDIARLKYEELMADLVFEVTRAYYNLVKTRKTYDLFKKLSDGSSQDFEGSRKRFAMGQSTAIENLTVENQRKQIDYNITSFEKDLALANLNLLEILFLKQDTSVEANADMPFQELSVELPEALRYASLRRYDIQIVQRELELNELGKRIGSASNAFKIDVSGFAGRSGGAYKNETLEMGEDYSAGVKVSKPFFGNTMSSSYLFDKTSPKLGQSTRTQSKTGSASLSLLDNIRGYGDELEGKIGYQQARIKLLQTNAKIEKEVRENYFNVQRAILQVKSSDGEVTLAQKEIDAAKAKKELNMAQISELISAKIKLANAQKSYYEALSFFNISVAALNKSVGDSTKYTVKEK